MDWWPSPFGADDQLGMLKHVDDAKRREALGLVREGRLYDLGRVLYEAISLFPGRFFRQTLLTTAHLANRNGGVDWVTEHVAATVTEHADVSGVRRLGIRDRAADRHPLVAGRRP